MTLKPLCSAAIAVQTHSRVQFVKPVEDLAKTFSTLRRRAKKQANGGVVESPPGGAVGGSEEVIGPGGAASDEGKSGSSGSTAAQEKGEDIPLSETSSESDENEGKV